MVGWYHCEEYKISTKKTHTSGVTISSMTLIKVFLCQLGIPYAYTLVLIGIYHPGM